MVSCWFLHFLDLTRFLGTKLIPLGREDGTLEQLMEPGGAAVITERSVAKKGTLVRNSPVFLIVSNVFVNGTGTHSHKLGES